MGSEQRPQPEQPVPEAPGDASTYIFRKEGTQWYIDLPAYIAQGGSRADLQMVEGADELLNLIGRGKKSVCLQLELAPFEGADLLELVELCDAPKGGGYYVLHRFRNNTISKRIWLCDVTLFVFGDMPERIYIRKCGLAPV